MENKTKIRKIGMIAVEAGLFFLLLYLSISTTNVFADVQEDNVTVTTYLDVGTSAPIIKAIDIESGSINLLPNSTKLVNCTVEIEDFDTDADIGTVEAKLFDNSGSVSDPDANNNHYTNTSCYVDTSYGDGNTALASCLFNLQYYSNPGTWNCSVGVQDLSGYTVNSSNTTTVEVLLAFGLPDSINYGTVNATAVSLENITNVTNFGNARVNLSLSGYGDYIGDGNAMNCTLGSLKNISIDYEKYNLTASTPGELNLTSFSGNYTSLTSSPTVKQFNLNYKQDDSATLAENQTYWRIYVPLGVAGTCSGNVVFGAVVAPEV